VPFVKRQEPLVPRHENYFKSAIVLSDSNRSGITGIEKRQTAHGLNPRAPRDSVKKGVDGYTMLEVYLNGLVSEAMK